MALGWSHGSIVSRLPMGPSGAIGGHAWSKLVFTVWYCISLKLGVFQKTISRQKSKMNICCYKREKTPKYSEKQAEKAKNFCKKLANLLQETSCCLILDDEKYFTYDGSNMQGNDNYHSNGKSKCQDSVRFAGKEKYHGKVMVWAAISNRGISKPLFRPSKSKAVYLGIYINE